MRVFVLRLEPEDLAQIQEVVSRSVAETIGRLATVRPAENAPLCFTEPEAAALLHLDPRVLADERRRKRIKASAIVGRRIRYTRQDLDAYLASRPWEAKA
jgi:hypothetical protein